MIAPVFAATRISPKVEEALGAVWLATTRNEGWAPTETIHTEVKTRGRPPASRIAVMELMSDGEWHSSKEVQDMLGIKRRNANAIIRSLGAEKRGRAGSAVEWRLP